MNREYLLAPQLSWGSGRPNSGKLTVARFPYALATIALLFSVVAAQAVTRTVTSGADDGAGTLRQTILTALPGDTINFAAGVGSVVLTSAELTIDKNLTIAGPGASLLTIQRSTANSTQGFRIFNISSNINVTFSGLTITRGYGAYPSPSGSIVLIPGVGILVNSGATATITACTITLNGDGSEGGGIYNSAGGTVTISNSILSRNDSGSHTDGGGIYNSSNGRVTITNSTISGNSAPNAFGGGIFNSDAGVVTITSSTISGNGGDGGGGGAYNSGTMTITNSTISGNHTRFRGGGIYNSSNGTVNLTITTIFGNIGGGGFPDLVGGVGNVGLVNARNTIIAKNPNGDFNGTLTSQGFNLIGNGSGATITPAQATDQIGTTAFPIDPMLGPLQDNGGPTFTHALLSGSPARDKGDSSGSNTDQRGFTRPVDNPAIPNAPGGDGSDIGAFEMQAGLAARSLNISTRSRVQTGDNVLIGGFIITGNVPKPVVLRGLGPSLANAGIPASTVLNDPVLELHGSSGALITSNDNWKESPQRSQIEGTVFQPSDDREAVIWTTLPPAAYTTVVRGKGSDTGVGLVEIYDLDQSSDSTLANLSSRAFVETGNNVLIGGFTLGGNNGSPQTIIRALGPSLAQLGITNPLANPTLELRDANGTLLVFNDDWKDDPAQSYQVVAAGLQPTDDSESAIAAALAPGAYTAIVAGKDGSTGIGVVEIYNLQ
jgi:hypothetical protein